MEVTSIFKDNVSGFEGVLLPQVYSEIAAGSHIPAIGLVESDKEDEGSFFAIGAIAGDFDGTVFDVTSFYVTKERRRMGGGSLLLDTLQKQLKKDTGSAITMDFFSFSEDHGTLESFLDKNGFIEEHEDSAVAVLISDIPRRSKGKKSDISGIPFAKVEDDVLKKLEEKIYNTTDYRIPDGGLFSDDVDIDCSMLYIKDDTPVSYVIYERGDSDTLMLTGIGAEAFELGIGLLECSLQFVVDRYQGEGRLLVFPASVTADDILGEYLGESAQDIRRCYWKSLSGKEK